MTPPPFLVRPCRVYCAYFSISLIIVINRTDYTLGFFLRLCFTIRVETSQPCHNPVQTVVI